MYNKGKTMGEIARKLQDDKIYAPSYNGFEKNKNGIGRLQLFFDASTGEALEL